MLIWTRANFDNLVYTLTVTLMLGGAFVGLVFFQLLLAVTLIFLGGFIFIMAVIWKS